jgi:hypothetical protein
MGGGASKYADDEEYSVSYTKLDEQFCFLFKFKLL